MRPNGVAVAATKHFPEPILPLPNKALQQRADRGGLLGLLAWVSTWVSWRSRKAAVGAERHAR